MSHHLTINLDEEEVIESSPLPTTSSAVESESVSNDSRRRLANTSSKSPSAKNSLKRKQQQQALKRRRNGAGRNVRTMNNVLENKCVQCAKNFILPSIVTTLTSIAWIIGTFVLIPGAFLKMPILFVLNQVMASTEVGLLLASYFKCVKTSPGYVSETWELDVSYNEEDRRKLLLLEPNKDGEARYCHKCGVYQPPRAHHSRAHNKCVLRMDHFCIWVNNVVGAFNHKFFYLFLFYLVIGVSHYFVIVGFYCWEAAQDLNNVNPLVFVVLIMFTVFLLPISLMVTMFFGWNTYLLMTNQTAIENHMNSDIANRLRFKQRKTGDKVPFKNIFNVKALDNMKSVLGENVLLWFIPTNPTGFDGYHFATIPMDEVERQNAYIQDARPSEDNYLSSSDDEYDDDYEEDYPTTSSDSDIVANENASNRMLTSV